MCGAHMRVLFEGTTTAVVLCTVLQATFEIISHLVQNNKNKLFSLFVSPGKIHS